MPQRWSTRPGARPNCAPAQARALRRAQVVCATCVGAGAGFLRGARFRYVLVDEAAQALEAETLVPLALCVAGTRVVLAGDPNQLGAAVRSPFAASKGLGTSLLERLIQRAAKDPGAAQVVRLSDNYRAHGSLLALPSKLFYDGSLRAKADEAVTASLLGWEKTALLCWGVNGSAAHELDSPSYFNALECAKVAQLVESLLASDRVRCDVGDIGEARAAQFCARSRARRASASRRRLAGAPFKNCWFSIKNNSLPPSASWQCTDVLLRDEWDYASAFGVDALTREEWRGTMRGAAASRKRKADTGLPGLFTGRDEQCHQGRA